MNNVRDLLLKFSKVFKGEIPSSFKGITTNLQHARKDDIVFYYLREGKEAEESLKLRLMYSNAGLIILNRRPNILVEGNLVIVKEDELSKIKNLLVDIFYPIKKKPQLIAITGTNGKTSTAWITSQILNQNGKKTYCLGTLGLVNDIGVKEEELDSTTPSFIDMRRILFELHHKEVDFLVAEVSSHALDQNRLQTIPPFISGWTNFTQDHLDYHITMDKYFASKLKIASQSIDKSIMISPDQVDLKKKITEKKIEYSEASFLGSDRLNEVPLFFRVQHNKENLALSYALAEKALGRKGSINFKKLTPPPGRFEVLKGNQVIVDYAHSPDAIFNLLSSIRELEGEKRITIIFGCGGNRDREKRALMGEIAEKNADNVIVTSDNPRYEKPEVIIADIAKGFKNKHTQITDRKEAIEYAIANKETCEIIVIAGKGHEKYQEVNGRKLNFDDVEIAKKVLANEE